MLLIAGPQMEHLAREARSRYVAELCAWLRASFQASVWAVAERELRERVEAALACAARHDLHSDRDCRRYLGLCITYGWDFEARPELAWMGERLADGEISSPSARLHLLIQQCIARDEIQASNQRLRQAFEAGQGEVAPDLYPDAAPPLLTTKD